MGRAENVVIFEDTKRRYETDARLAEAVRNSVADQVLITEQTNYPVHGGDRIYADPAVVKVSGRRSFAAAFRYGGQKVCVLNFASASTPGGGVTRGSSAQEECLCRCSTLYAALSRQEMWDGFYIPHREEGNSLHNDDCIYTPGVVVFKSDTNEPQTVPERMWFSVDVLTCAAPNLRERPANRMNPGDRKPAANVSDEELRLMHEKRMRRVMDIAVGNGVEVLILGAFGCGAFRNPPEVVAQAMKNVLEDYRYCFRTVEFAVYCSPQDDTNRRVFEDVFREYA